MINLASLVDELTLRPQEGRKERKAGPARPRMYFPLSFPCLSLFFPLSFPCFNSFDRLGS